MLIANHCSLLDGILVAAYMPEKITFAINTEWAKKWYISHQISYFYIFGVAGNFNLKLFLAILVVISSLNLLSNLDKS